MELQIRGDYCSVCIWERDHCVWLTTIYLLSKIISHLLCADTMLSARAWRLRHNCCPLGTQSWQKILPWLWIVYSPVKKTGIYNKYHKDSGVIAACTIYYRTCKTLGALGMISQELLRCLTKWIEVIQLNELWRRWCGRPFHRYCSGSWDARGETGLTWGRYP